MTKKIPIDIVQFNKRAWNNEVRQGNPWTIPVSEETLLQARRGVWSIVLTPTKPVPEAWFGDVRGKDILCLASGGGQQGPVLAAAGARVTVFDNSPAQLQRDRDLSDTYHLEITAVEGDMADLSAFGDASFDIIVHPVSNVFCSDILPVWREAHRVLRPGGRMMAGFCNPLLYLFDAEQEDRGVLQVRHKIPYSDIDSITPEERLRIYGGEAPLEFGHSLEDQIGGQIAAGFSITGFYEDSFGGEKLLDAYIYVFMATLAEKPSRDKC